MQTNANKELNAALTARRANVLKMLAQISKAVEPSKGDDWAVAGSLGHAEEVLADLVSFLGA